MPRPQKVACKKNVCSTRCVHPLGRENKSTNYKKTVSKFHHFTKPKGNILKREHFVS